MVLALSVFALSIVLIMVRPKPFNEATAASLGAFLMLVTGAVTLPEAFDVLKSTANILLFFIGLMVISSVAEQSGFFEWSALKAVGYAGGSGRKLLLVVFFLGAVVTAFFSNDATALVLTPVVYLLVSRLRLDPLPYVFACAFVANTASMLLPVSNPVNLLAVDRFGLTLGEYLRFLLAPSVLALLVNFALFCLIFRRGIPAKFPDFKPERPFRADGFFRFVCVGVVCTAAGYVFVLTRGLPAALPALAGAAFLVGGGIGFKRLSRRSVAAGMQWSILLFIFSLALLVKGLENAGATRALGEALASLAEKGSFGAIAATTFLTAFGSNLINNWSMMMVSVSSLGSIGNPAPDRSLVYSSILGADLGPNIAILGSLSSMLWLVLLRRRELDIHPLQYLKLGLIVTPPMLAIGAASIYMTGGIQGI